MTMKIKLLGAKTGQGHISALQAVEEEMKRRGVTPICYPSFYEEISVYNELLSNFNNLLAMKSLPLSIELNQLYILEGRQIDIKKYQLYCPYFDEVLHDDNQILVSFTPLINKYIIHYCTENHLNSKIYIVVTDPYKPMYPGFDAVGADGYFCPSAISAAQLVKSGIEKEKIEMSGFPLRGGFLCRHTDRQIVREMYHIPDKPIILINCGAYGNPLFISLIKELAVKVPQYHYLVVCGKNNTLKLLLKKYIQSVNIKNVTLFDYVESIQDLMELSVICITKAGACTIHECIASHTLPLVLGYYGLQYQERGVFDYLQEIYGLNLRFESQEKMVRYLRETNLDAIEEERKKLHTRHLKGAETISEKIIEVSKTKG